MPQRVVQQSAPLEHGAPTLKHELAEQMEFTQWAVQQSAGPVHAAPAALHVGAQTLFWQTPLQHVEPLPQGVPSGRQPPSPPLPDASVPGALPSEFPPSFELVWLPQWQPAKRRAITRYESGRMDSSELRDTSRMNVAQDCIGLATQVGIARKSA